MKSYSSEAIRNIALISHGGAGKTSLAESTSFHQRGDQPACTIETGTTTTDYDPDEIKRQVTINVGLAPPGMGWCKD